MAVVAVVAVALVAIGTVSGAVADDPLTGGDIKRNSLTSRDIRDLKAKDFTKRVREQFETTGPQGAQGPPGVQGVQGPPGSAGP